MPVWRDQSARRTGSHRSPTDAADGHRSGSEEFVAIHGDRGDAGGNRLEVRPTRVRDNGDKKECRVRFSSAILPPYLRRSKAIDELIPWLYLKGISTGDFSEALQSLLGAAGLPPITKSQIGHRARFPYLSSMVDLRL
jgi:hypothetical protein